MATRKLSLTLWLTLLICVAAVTASAQSFRVQCPTSTITHPFHAAAGVDCTANPSAKGCNNDEPAYNGPTQFGMTPISGSNGGYVTPTANTNGAIKCQQISGGDGYSTMADGVQEFMFSFGPLSGLADVVLGHPSTQFPNVYNSVYPGTLVRGDPATTDGATSGGSPWSLQNPPTVNPLFTWNGAVGLTPDVVQVLIASDLIEGNVAAPATTGSCPNPPAATSSTSTLVTAYTFEPLGIAVGQQVVVSNTVAQGGVATPPGYAGTYTVTCVADGVFTPMGFTQHLFQFNAASAGLAADTGNDKAAMLSTPPVLDGHVDPRQIMDIGVMNGNIPAPLASFDEDDEFFLTLTNVGMIMRPDLFEQHTVHFHGYPNASSFYDGVPDASIAINIGASFTYYYLAPDAGTYFWHCHITPPEHLQMGMVGQLHVRPRQDRVPMGQPLRQYLGYQNGVGLPNNVTADLRTECNPGMDILCSATMPAIDTGALQTTDKLGNPQKYVYNDGDGSTGYDVEYPLQMHGFDPNFHFIGMTFNPEMFADMKDKYFLLNGRSYPDTVAPGPQATISSDGTMHYSQPLPAIINIPVGGRAALRLVNLSVSEYHTLASLGIPMKEIGFNAKLLRDQAGLNTEFYTNSITLGGGESLDVILDASDASCGSAGCAAILYPAGSVFYLFTPQLDHLANDAENFGGLMTEVHICNSVTNGVPAPNASVQYPIDNGSTFGNTCN